MATAQPKDSAKPYSGVFGRFALWGRNARILVGTEPLWSIPMNWVFFYRPIFLSEAIGLTAVQIGLLSTVLNFSSILSPLAGGYLADRFGRKRVLMLFDSITWVSSLAVWVVTRNIWYALVAYLLESIVSVINPVWECMLVEDTAPEHRASIYGYISAIYNIGALSTPVAGYIVGLYGVDLGSRTLFGIALASVIPMFIIRQLYLRETELGRKIMKERSFAGLDGYYSSLSMIRKNRVISALVITSIIGSFYYAAVTYLPLYLTKGSGLGLGEDVASLVPAASSVSALFIASFVVSRLRSRSGYMKVLVSGYGLGCLALLLLSFSPKGSLSMALISAAVLGVYSVTAFSVSRTFLTNEIESVDSRARAKILSVTLTLSSLIGLPAPTLAGYLFSLDPKLPFLAVSGTLILSSVMLLLSVKNEKQKKWRIQ